MGIIKANKKKTLLLFVLITLFPFNTLFSVSPDSTGLRNYVKELTKYIYFKDDSILPLLDSAAGVYRAYGDTKDRAYACNVLGTVYLNLGKSDSALAVFNRGIQVAKAIHDTSRLLKLMQSTGVVYARSGRFDSAAMLYFDSYRLAKKTGDSLMVSVLSLELANMLLQRGTLDTAMFYCLEAKPYLLSHKMYGRLTYLYSLMAGINQYSGQFDKGIAHLQQAIKYNQLDGRFNALPNIMSNMGQMFIEKGEKDSGLYYLNRALELVDVEYQPNYYYAILNNLGNYYYDTEQYDKALTYFKRIYKSGFFDKNEQIKSAVLINLGFVYFNLGKYDTALVLIEEGKNSARQIGLIDYEKNAYNFLFRIDTALGKWKEAIKYQERYYHIQDSILNQTRLQAIDSLQSVVELERQISKNKLLISENRIKDELIKQNKTALFLISAFLFIFLVIIILLILSRKRIKILLRDVASKNNQIKDVNTKLSKNNEKLKELNTTKDKLFSIISHDLIAPFNSLIGIIDILDSNEYEISEPQKRHLISVLKEAANSSYTLLKNLLSWASIQRGKITVNYSEVKLHDVVEEEMKLYSVKAGQKQIQLINEVPKDFYLQADRQLITNIINNLINNAIKFSYAGGIIKVWAKSENDKSMVCVEDSGVGIPEDKTATLFQINNSYNRTGTNKERGTGLGLVLCKDFVQLMGGRIFVESEVGKGSRFCIELPVYHLKDQHK